MPYKAFNTFFTFRLRNFLETEMMLDTETEKTLDTGTEKMLDTETQTTLHIGIKS